MREVLDDSNIYIAENTSTQTFGIYAKSDAYSNHHHKRAGVTYRYVSTVAVRELHTTRHTPHVLANFKLDTHDTGVYREIAVIDVTDVKGESLVRLARHGTKGTN